MNARLGFCALLCAAWCLATPMLAQQTEVAPQWKRWDFLLGEWEAEGGGQPGQGTSTFSFRVELEGKILVRKNFNDYPATKDRPAIHHEDLMVIYPDTDGKRTRAIYWDNEGHVLLYTAELSADGDTLTELSDLLLGAPRFRLTYTKGKDGALAVRFDIAPPGKPDAFSTYVSGTAHHKKP